MTTEEKLGNAIAAANSLIREQEATITRLTAEKFKLLADVDRLGCENKRLARELESWTGEHEA